MFFSQRPPSTQWEALPVHRLPGTSLWAWFRPQHVPSGVAVTIPPEFAAVYPAGLPITLLDLLQAAGIPPETLYAVSIYRADWQPAAVVGTFLGHPLPSPVAGGSSEILISVIEQTAQAHAAGAPLPAAWPSEPDDGTAGDSEELSGTTVYDRVDAAWRSAIQMERQMTALRQKLSSVLNSMGKYDRDLQPNERLAADREDRDAWHDARRWLRDLSARVHREIKSFDIGMTSAAGKRNWMQETYDTIIKPRVPTNDIENIRREFEVYRKDMVNLQKAMQAALQAATQNGTQRAQRILGVISRKIKERRAKMREPLGGTNMDRSVRRKT